MCGISGFWRPGSRADESVAMRMSKTLFHRGPDDGGVWLDPAAGLALCHRRLAIIDLSAAGHQPMHSSSGRYVISFNGEIYNHVALRTELEKSTMVPPWRGHSDTETLLASVEAWGLENTLKKAVGMFALAVWDRQERLLSLARDRMGEKPLYYGCQNGTWLFGSELKALRVHPEFAGKINRAALPLYFRHGYIPAPHSIYEGIYKVPPGEYLTLTEETRDRVLARPYWSLPDQAVSGVLRQRQGLPLSEAVEELDVLLGDSIRGQMMSDVPLGAFLSGGVDSSAVVARMQALAPGQVKTFSIGFHQAAYNEAEHARAIASFLGTAHTELFVTPAETLDVVPRLAAMFDEPFGDPSQIPTFLVACLARNQVTVALSGDGGDELFGGYRRYTMLQSWEKRVRLLPGFARQGLAAVMSALPMGRMRRLQRSSEKLSGILRAGNPTELYRQTRGHWLSGDRLLIDDFEPPYWLNAQGQSLQLGGPVDSAMLADAMVYLPDDILVKLDRAAMAVSLETRVPLLDHRIVEWSWSLPQELKTAGGHEKRVLRELLFRYVPRELVDRPKMGFGAPIGEWLRGPLRDWAEDLLDPKKIHEAGFFRPEPLQQKWVEHQEGRADWRYHLWDVLMFQSWLKEQPA